MALARPAPPALIWNGTIVSPEIFVYLTIFIDIIICIPLCSTTAAFNLSSTNFTQVIICTKYVQVLEWSYSEKEITEYLYSVYTNKNQALLLCDPELSLKVSNER